MSEEATPRPTIESVLERINALGERRTEDSKASRQGLTGWGFRLDRMDARLDRTQAEVLELRMDFREFRTRFKESA